MTIQVGDTLPAINLTVMTEEGPKPKKRRKLTIQRKMEGLYILPAVVVFIIFK